LAVDTTNILIGALLLLAFGGSFSRWQRRR
jgi:hypothetical protein